MFETLLKQRFIKKTFFLYFISSDKRFKKPITQTFLFVLEFLIISYCYVLLHNSLNSVDEAISFSTSMYFTVISASTVGYGDHYPIFPATQWYVICLMIIYLPFRFFYVLGCIGFLFKDYSDRKYRGRWFPMLHEHVVVYCNAAAIEKHNFIWLQRFVEEKRRSLKFRNADILLVNGNPSANERLITYFSEQGLEQRNVHFVNCTLEEADFMKKISIDKAIQVYVLADQHDDHSDSHVFDVVYRIYEETSFCGGITVELVSDSNRSRLARLGVNVMLRPNRSMPEMLVSCTIAPGTAQMLEELTSRGGDSIERFTLTCGGFLWGDLLYQLSMHDVGTATAVIYDNEYVDSNPKGTTTITDDAKAILVIINEMRTKSYEEIQEQITMILQQKLCKR